MEITKAKNFDTNGVAEFESVDEETHEVTPDMKYIKWPSKKKVFSELVSVAVASIIIASRRRIISVRDAKSRNGHRKSRSK